MISLIDNRPPDADGNPLWVVMTTTRRNTGYKTLPVYVTADREEAFEQAEDFDQVSVRTFVVTTTADPDLFEITPDPSGTYVTDRMNLRDPVDECIRKTAFIDQLADSLYTIERELQTEKTQVNQKSLHPIGFEGWVWVAMDRTHTVMFSILHGDRLQLAEFLGGADVTWRKEENRFIASIGYDDLMREIGRVPVYYTDWSDDPDSNHCYIVFAENDSPAFSYRAAGKYATRSQALQAAESRNVFAKIHAATFLTPHQK